MEKRYFIAINLPKQAIWQIQSIVAELKRQNQNSAIKFATFDQIHLTLHFLGNLRQEQLGRVKTILKAIAGDFRTFEFKTTKLGGFPDLKRPKIIFLGIDFENDNSLSRLHNEINLELEKIGFETEKRPWQPHLTLARVKAPIRFSTRGIETPELIVPVASIDLMESRLSPSGPEHELLDSFFLRQKNMMRASEG